MIGIISWLPDDEDRRNVRFSRLLVLLNNIKKLFPKENILIVAQNYQKAQIDQLNKYSNMNIHEYGKLGIVRARNILRNLFLETKEDYIIMYDDDSELHWDNNEKSDSEIGNAYLQKFKDSRYGFLIDRDDTVKNFIISREWLTTLTFKGFADHDFFEDCQFHVDLLNKMFIKFNTVYKAEIHQNIIQDESPCGGEPYRTWTEKDRNLDYTD